VNARFPQRKPDAELEELAESHGLGGPMKRLLAAIGG
jgi:hypothetical protein